MVRKIKCSSNTLCLLTCRMRYFLAALAITSIIYSSCVQVVENCTKPEVDEFIFNATDTIRDNSATLYRYEYGTGFAQHTHTFERQPTVGASVVYLSMRNYVSPSKYDWKIVLHPSEKTFYIRDISFSTKNVKGKPFSTICTDKVTYTVNDVRQEYTPQNPSPTAAAGSSLPIPY